MFIVLNQDGDPIYTAGYAQACHEHINDAINEYNIEGAGKWKVVEVVPKQRELELLAVIKRQRDYIKDRGHEKNCEWHKDKIKDGATYCDCGLNDVLVIEPSQALREHEAKVLEDAATFFDGESYTTRDENSCVMDFAENQLRRMAEERRKK